MQERAPQTLAVAFPTSRLRPLNGHVEMRIADAVSASLSRTDQVTEIVSALFDRIGGEVNSRDLVRRLATGARAWLLMQAARVFHADQTWFSARCDACAEPYDLNVNLADIPRSKPDEDFPVTTVRTSIGARRFEIPNGLVEAKLIRAEPKDAPRLLASLTGLSKQADLEANAFSDGDLTRIDAALDAATPDVAEEVTTLCPACQSETHARLDPLEFAFPNADHLDREIFLIAKTYGWDEPTILALPSDRRRRHARMISSEMRRVAR